MSPGGKRWVAAALGALVLGAGILGLRALAGRPSADEIAFRATEPALDQPPLFAVPAFQFRDQRGQPVTREHLAGRVWIANFIYTTCTSVCPTLAAKFVMLARKLGSPEIRFVSFSVDPAHDTPEALADYAGRFRSGDARWLLLATDPPGLAALARDLRVAVEPTRDARDPILHSTKFFLIDRKGDVRGIYDSSDPMSLARLAADAGALAGASVAPPAAGDGRGLMEALGCDGCHENGALAPSLRGVWGREVELEGGGTVSADEAYVRESILAPGAKLVRGYLNLMPAYGAELSGEGLTALVEHIRSLAPLPAGQGSAAPESEVELPTAPVVDPVCDMQVRVTSGTPRARHAGREHYFCSAACRATFVAAPAKYAK